MAKRFTETDKWNDVWFSELPSKYKLLWIYLLDSCDNAGIYQVNFRNINFYIGESIEPSEAMRILKGRVVSIKDGKYWFIPKFITYQYGNKLSTKNLAVKNVIDKLSKYDLLNLIPNIEIIEGASKELQRSLQAPKEKEKDKYKDKDILKELDIDIENNVTCNVTRNVTDSDNFSFSPLFRQNIIEDTHLKDIKEHQLAKLYIIYQDLVTQIGEKEGRREFRNRCQKSADKNIRVFDTLLEFIKNPTMYDKEEKNYIGNQVYNELPDEFK